MKIRRVVSGQRHAIQCGHCENDFDCSESKFLGENCHLSNLTTREEGVKQLKVSKQLWQYFHFYFAQSFFWFVVKQLESDATRDDMWTVRFSFSLALGIKWCSRMTMTIMTMIAHIMGVGVVGVKIGQSELCSCFPPKSFVMVHHESWYHEIICRCTQMLRCVKSRKAAILCLRTEAQAGGQALQVIVMMLVMVIRKCYL